MEKKRSLAARAWLWVFVLTGGFAAGAAHTYAADNCRKTYPKPVIKVDHKDAEGRIYIPVLNWAVYDNEMFRSAPDLPPCGANSNASRTWVDIYNADTNARIYGFCAFNANTDLKRVWFMPAAPGGRVYIILNDRACRKSYKSNIVMWGDNCRKKYPKPVIKVDHKDAEGRIYIPVVNWNAYDDDMFRQAAELPPCGANPNASRTWVDIYNAATNAYIYGFCALGAKADLKTIWFLPPAPRGRVYILLKDRACNKTYKSNTIVW
jgi:hypothetical protein